MAVVDATGYWSNKPDCEETESSINLHRSLHIHRRPGAAIHWISAFVVISNILHLIVIIIITIILNSHHSHDPVLISLFKNPEEDGELDFHFGSGSHSFKA